MSDHPTAALDDVVHQKHRLALLTVAAEAKRVEFGYLQRNLDLTKGNLSRHISVLADAGLLAVEKGYDGKTPKTWVHITNAGRRALAEEIDTLRALVARHDRTEPAPESAD